MSGLGVVGHIGPAAPNIYGLIKLYNTAGTYPGGTGAHIVVSGTYRMQ